MNNQYRDYTGSQKPKASVLIPIIETDKGDLILFERRSEDLKMQPGDVCFPGGGIEPGETPLEAALRETSEELLIPVENISQVKFYKNTLGPFKKYLVSVFYGKITDYHGSFSKEETESTFLVPVDFFGTFHKETKMYPEYHFKDYRIWGFTARLVRDFLKEVYK